MRLLPLFLALLLGPVAAAAQGVSAFVNPCPVASLPCGTAFGVGSLGLINYLGNFIFPAVRGGFVAIAVIFFSAYAFRMLLEAEDENTVTEVKNAYTYAIVGAVFVSISTFIVDGFGRNAALTLVNPLPVAFAVNNVIGYFKLIVGVLLSVLITVQGIRLILLQGEESELAQQRKRFLHGLIGVAVILLANTLVAVFVPDVAGLYAVENEKSLVLGTELIGILNFGLEILAVLAVLAMLTAGVMLIVSADESVKERAKKIVFGTVIALVVVFCSYAIVNYFLGI